MDMKKFRKSARKIIHEGKFLRFINQGGWEYVQRNNCTGIVIIAPITDKNELIFVEQFRPPVNKKVIEFPAGLVNDRGHKTRESMVRAAKRELVEETGYSAKKAVKVFKGPTSGGSSADLITLIIATGLKKISDGGGDETEDIVVHKVAMRQVDGWLDKMAEKGYLIEPKIYTGLYWINKYNKLSNNK